MHKPNTRAKFITIDDMKNSDRYICFAQLQRHERQDESYSIHTHNPGARTGVFAPHGGGIEPGTSELAQAIAAGCAPVLALYCFEGLSSHGCQALHITSVNFDEPQALALANTLETVVSVHGCQGHKPVTYVGGLDTTLQAGLISNLNAAGFSVVGGQHTRYSGQDPRNLCNRGRRGRGVQLELSLGLRREMFAGLGRLKRQQQTVLFHQFVTAVRAGLKTHEARQTLTHNSSEIITAAITWAKQQTGTHQYPALCLAFTEDAYELGANIELDGQGRTAKEAADAYGTQPASSPPSGAFVFYDTAGPVNGQHCNWGHVGLSLGDGQIVHTWRGLIRQDDYLTVEQLAPPEGWTTPKYIGWTPAERILVGMKTRDPA